MIYRKKQRFQQQTELRQARLARVPPEPTEGFGVKVRVRHITMGIQERRFPSSSLMSAIYDWARSQCEEPENFTLRDCLGQPFQQSDQILDQSLVTMVVSEETPSLYLSDRDIQFRGFGRPENGSNDTLEDDFTAKPQILLEIIIRKCNLF